MTMKLRFKPVITQIKLNPEQAVLACTCWSTGTTRSNAGTRFTVCVARTRGTESCSRTLRSTTTS